MVNPLLKLHHAGQAVWLDFLRRGLLTGGVLERMVHEDGLAGVTSNPSIFGKAIAALREQFGGHAVKKR
jgi:transaldolase